ncbi:hypothetical protein ZWY2020_014331 [Hordeum vulgare]|nr:hypothetical protein ZWY2020_014331 [Hordeum vulgare]
MNTTPPSQLRAPAAAGDSGRRGKGEPPLVPADVAPLEEANADDVMDEDGDEPNQYINTSYDDAREYDSGYEHGDDLMMRELLEPQHPTGDCKKSLFMRSSREPPPDAASTQQEQHGGRSLVISPMTLGMVVREGMVGSLPPPAKKRRRRAEKKGSKGARAASSSHPPLKPREVDKIPVIGADRFHVIGKLILPQKALENIQNNDLRRLHDDVLAIERRFINTEKPGHYPIYPA